MKGYRNVHLWVLMGLGLSLQACESIECEGDRSIQGPSPSIQCAAADVCYLGQCAHICTAGQEQVDPCSSDVDCEAPRNKCVDGYCSACELGESCISGLDICQSVTDIEIPPAPDASPDPSRRPPLPVDGGSLDDGLVRTRDAGVVVIEDRPVSYLLHAELGLVENHLSNVTTSTAVVSAHDVRGNPAGLEWIVIEGHPLVETRTGTASEGCELLELVEPSIETAPVDFGPVAMSAGGTVNDAGVLINGLNGLQEVRGVWSMGGYAIIPNPLPNPLLNLSELSTGESYFLGVTGEGQTGITDRSWPSDGDESIHVPYRLELEPPTEALISSVQKIGLPPLVDLDLRWIRIGTGVVAGEAIEIRIEGQRHRIRCRETEGPTASNIVRIKAGLLEQFARVEGGQSGDRFPLIIERRNAVQFQADPPPAEETDGGTATELRLEVTARIRHTHVGAIEL